MGPTPVAQPSEHSELMDAIHFETGVELERIAPATKVMIARGNRIRTDSAESSGGRLQRIVNNAQQLWWPATTGFSVTVARALPQMSQR